MTLQMTETFYSTKWTLDLLLERFYTTRHYLEHEYGNSTFEECYQQVQEINERVAKKTPETLTNADLKEYINITPEICRSCHYWYRWGIEHLESDRIDVLNSLSETKELLKTLEPFIKSSDFTGCPEIEFNTFMSTFWSGLAFNEYEEAISQAERLYKFFESIKNIKSVRWVPFPEMNDPMSNLGVNWSRYHLSLSLLLGKAYFVNKQYDLAAKTYQRAINAHYDETLIQNGVQRIHYHMGVNRLLEAATELYILEQTDEHKDQVLNLFLECVRMPTDPTFEAVLETLLINYMVYENVFGVRVG